MTVLDRSFTRRHDFGVMARAVGQAPVKARQPPRHSASGLRTVLRRLAAAYGPQQWWPAHDPFEMMAGALLTQRTTWRNAERAIASLRRAGVLSPEALAIVSVPRLEALIRTAGTFRTKAVRLKALALWYVDAGGRDALAARSTADLRSELLALPGIGPETARRHSRLRLRPARVRRRRLRAADPVAPWLGAGGRAVRAALRRGCAGRRRGCGASRGASRAARRARQAALPAGAPVHGVSPGGRVPDRKATGRALKSRDRGRRSRPVGRARGRGFPEGVLAA